MKKATIPPISVLLGCWLQLAQRYPGSAVVFPAGSSLTGSECRLSIRRMATRIQCIGEGRR
jgi:hypothetical protein